MICINCFHKKTNVVNSRPQLKQPLTWRRRKCPHCLFTFTTHETYQLDDILLIQSENGQAAAYNKGKLLASVIEALLPTGDDAVGAYWLVSTIEARLISDHKATGQWQPVSSAHLASLTFEALTAFNQAAGMGYGVKHKLLSMSQKRKPGRPSKN